MKDVLNWLVDSLKSGNFHIGIVIITVALAFNYKKIVEFIDDRKKAKLFKITEALACDHINGLTEEYLKEELATEHFKLATGVRLEKQFREAVIKAHKSARGKISFMHFKRAIPYFSFQQGNLNVEISKFEEARYWFNFCLGLAAAFFGLITMVLLSQTSSFNFVHFVGSFGMGALLIVASLFLFSETFPVASAKKIDKALSSTASNNSETK